MTTAASRTSAASRRFALFDLDETLVDTTGALLRWCLEFVAEHGLESRYDGDVQAAALALTADLRAAPMWEFAQRAERDYGIAIPPEDFIQQIAATYPMKFTLEPEVAEGLGALREDGWRLGIVTNGSRLMQHAKIAHVGLRRHVDFIVDSESAGVRKPERRIFELAARNLGVELGPDGWMVGDDYLNDVVGGHGAGLRTVWLPNGVPAPEHETRPDHAAESVAEAIKFIAAAE